MQAMDIQKTALRLPQDLHQLVINAAQLAGRSMNAEIVNRLRASFTIDTKSEVNGTINDLGGKGGLSEAQREEVAAMIMEAIGKKVGG